jgi:hypothetical protein
MLLSPTAFPQCNCEEIKRDDGTNILQCAVVQVASDQTTQVGIGTASNGESIFITLTVRFKNTAQYITKDLYIRLDDNNMISLPFVNSSLSYIGNSQVANGIFSLPEKQTSKFLKSAIKTISFNLTNGLLVTYQVDMNKDVLEKQINCIPQFKTGSKLDDIPQSQTGSKLDELDKKNGFRSLQFGKSVNEISDFKLELNRKVDGESVYSISNPDIKINEVPVKSIDCYFIMDKLVRISIELDLWGRSNVSASNVVDLLVSTFGTPQDSYPDLNLGPIKSIYVNVKSWVGKKVKLTYHYVSSQGQPNSYSVNYEVIDYQTRQRDAKDQYINSRKGDL